MGLQLKASAGQVVRIPAGFHTAEIVGAPILEHTNPSEKGHPWTDPTPFLAVTCRVEGFADAIYRQPLRSYKKRSGEKMPDLSAEIASATKNPKILKELGITKQAFEAKSTDEQQELLFDFVVADEAYGDPNEQYAVWKVGEKKGQRVPTTVNQEDDQSMKIAGRMGVHAGLCEPEESFNTDDLQGCNIGIEVISFHNKGDGKTYAKIVRTMTVDEAFAKAND